jgi:Zn-dependent protease
MHDSIRLGRIAGVEVGFHWSLLLTGGLLAAGLARGRFPAHAPGYSGAAYVLAAGATALVFLGCVLVHELSHAVVARRAGIGVDGITLWFLGGVTRLTSEATTPKVELAVSGAGPLASLVLGVVMVGGGIALEAAAVSPLVVATLTWLGVINIVLAAFNVLPGAPLDGGRLLHAFVWSRHGDPRRATRTASRAGEILGAILIAFGLLEFAFGTAVGGGLWIAFIGWFLRTGARAEEAHAEEAHAEAHHALQNSTLGGPRRDELDGQVAGVEQCFLALGVAPIRAVGVGVEELSNRESIGGFSRTHLSVDGHRHNLLARHLERDRRRGVR